MPGWGGGGEQGGGGGGGVANKNIVRSLGTRLIVRSRRNASLRHLRRLGTR